jgi:cobalt-zinc-cadmium efflux system membrane fusion protein
MSISSTVCSDSPSPPTPGGVSPTSSLWQSPVFSRIVNLLVFGLLGVVLIFGHHSGWTMPRYSELAGKPSDQAGDWCAEHLVPESQCVECQADLMPTAGEFGFCRKHGVNECVICHPELAEVNGKPQLPQYDTVQALELVARPQNNSKSTLHKRRVQFASAESALKAGIDVDVVEGRPMRDILKANGELMFDPTRVAHLSSRVPGTVAAVFKTLGDRVQAGDVLAVIDGALVGQAKSQLLHAVVQLHLRRTNVERLRSAASSLPARTLVEAEAALQEAEIGFISARQSLVNLGFEVPEQIDGRDAKKVAADLQFLGIPDAIRKGLPVGARTANLIPIRAPYDGALVASDVVAGEVVNTTTMLLTVASPDRLWLTLSVRQEDARYLAAGLPVTFRTDDSAQEATGRISWISPAIDEKTRSVQVRVPLDNIQGKLRDRTFGTGTIELREEPHAIVVPREAVQSTSDAQFVFVRDRNYLTEDGLKVFHVRQVRTGARDDQYVELLAGALPGEVVATKGSAVLLAQLLRSNLGAGCGCHEH